MASVFGLNPTIYSGASFSARIDGIPLTTVQSYSFKISRERPHVYAMNPTGLPVGRPRGQVTFEPMALKLLHAEAQEVIDYLGAKGLGDVTKPEFTMTITFLETGIGARPTTLLCERCVVNEFGESTAVGTEALAMDFVIDTLSIRVNGLGASSFLDSII